MADLTASFDMSDFLERSAVLSEKMKLAKQNALRIVADELLRLSQREVPFVTGELMSSGVSQPDGEDGYIVGYNKPYAAYMHEGHWFDGSHVIENYSNNRKGKYLEDPLKMNKDIFREYFGQSIKAELSL